MRRSTATTIASALLSVSALLASGDASADEIILRDGKTCTGNFKYFVYGVQTGPQDLAIWPTIRKITDDKGAVLFEGPEVLPEGAEKGLLPDAGELKGSLYVNSTLGFSMEIPSGKDVQKHLRKDKEEMRIDGLDISPFIQVLSLLALDLNLDTDKIKNKAMLEVFETFPNRLYVVAHTGLSGIKGHTLLQRMAEGEAKQYLEGWQRVFEDPEDASADGDKAGEKGKAKDKSTAKAKEITLGGQKAFTCRVAKTEKRVGRFGGGKWGRNEMKREREVEITVVQRGDVVVFVLMEVTAPDDLVEALRLRLRKVVGSIRFDKPA